MRPLRYSINITVDGCAHHEAGIASPVIHAHHTANLARADAVLFGRVVYQMMESAWRPAAAHPTGTWTDPFAQTIDTARKYVVSTTLASVDWNAELIRGDLATAVRALKEQPGDGILTGGITLPRALAELGLIDEYEFVVQPRLAGHGPHVFEGLAAYVDLVPRERRELDDGSLVLTYVPKG